MELNITQLNDAHSPFQPSGMSANYDPTDLKSRTGAAGTVAVKGRSPIKVDRGDGQTVDMDIRNGQLVPVDGSSTEDPVETIRSMRKRTASVLPARKLDAAKQEEVAKEEPAVPAAEPVHTAPVVEPVPIAPRKNAPRVKVVVEAAGMGRMRFSVSTVAVNVQSIGTDGTGTIVLSYDMAEDASVFEPPTASAESPLLVTINNKTYKCISGNWSVELGGNLLIILIVIEVV